MSDVNQKPRPPARVTTSRLRKMKAAGEKAVMVTAYDFPSGRFADEAGIDLVLVGDSMGNVVQGHDTTLPVTLEESLYHTRIVARACQRAMVIGDMPFGTYHESSEQAVRSAVRYLKEAGAQAVKLEGGRLAEETIAALVRAQIPTMAHIGLTPQSVHVMGGFKVQRDEAALLADAQRVQDAGAFAVVLEGIPAAIAAKITGALEIPTIGIGAGVGCDGQVLVWHDLLGINDGFVPKFVKPYATLASAIRDALGAFRDDVRSGKFPDDAHSY